MKIFGREPALIVGFVGAVLTVLVSLNLSWFSVGQAAAAGTFITAMIIAAATRPVGPAVFVACLSAGAALFYQYGLHLSDALVAGLSGLLLAGFALFGIRPQVTPKDDPRTIDGKVVVR